jgi:3-dehydroquinate synthase
MVCKCDCGFMKNSKVETLHVRTKEHSYPIHLGWGLDGSLLDFLRQANVEGRPLVAAADATVLRLHRERLASLFGAMPVFEIPSGEPSKSFSILAGLLSFMSHHRLDRSGCLLAIGGGVTGDLAGFAAATYLRGIEFVQIPTTLLAMVDSSVGGKTGINLPEGKNLVGAFHQPVAVFADLEFLKTLPEREFAAGMGEVLKYALLGDVDFYTALGSMNPPPHPGHPELPGIVRRCCEMKAAIVQADEKETATNGGRALLNLGHTFAHAIEAVAGYGVYLHGEAVAIGLSMASALSAITPQRPGQHTFAKEDSRHIDSLLRRFHLPTRLRASLPVEALMAAMSRDKKVRAGKLRFVLMSCPGQAFTSESVDQDLIRRLWVEFGASVECEPVRV